MTRFQDLNDITASSMVFFFISHISQTRHSRSLQAGPTVLDENTNKESPLSLAKGPGKEKPNRYLRDSQQGPRAVSWLICTERRPQRPSVWLRPCSTTRHRQLDHSTCKTSNSAAWCLPTLYSLAQGDPGTAELAPDPRKWPSNSGPHRRAFFPCRWQQQRCVQAPATPQKWGRPE